MNPFTYTKNPSTILEAQMNINYWWYEGMEMPEGVIEAHWKTFIKEMKYQAKKDLDKLDRIR
jgi:hypothetical protein